MEKNYSRQTVSKMCALPRTIPFLHTIINMVSNNQCRQHSMIFIGMASRSSRWNISDTWPSGFSNETKVYENLIKTASFGPFWNIKVVLFFGLAQRLIIRPFSNVRINKRKAIGYKKLLEANPLSTLYQRFFSFLICAGCKKKNWSKQRNKNERNTFTFPFLQPTGTS